MKTLGIEEATLNACLAEAQHEGVVLTRGGEAAAVLLSIEAYRRAARERELLLRLARGEAEIAANQGVDSDEVFAEVDALLEDHSG